MPTWCPLLVHPAHHVPVVLYLGSDEEKVAFTPRSETVQQAGGGGAAGPSSKVRAISFCPAGTVGQRLPPSPASALHRPPPPAPARPEHPPGQRKKQQQRGDKCRARRRQEVRSIPPAAFPKSFGLSMRCWRDCLRCKFCYCAGDQGSPLRKHVFIVGGRNSYPSAGDPPDRGTRAAPRGGRRGRGRSSFCCTRG